jgi:hypothetical protein
MNTSLLAGFDGGFEIAVEALVHRGLVFANRAVERHVGERGSGDRGLHARRHVFVGDELADDEQQHQHDAKQRGARARLRPDDEEGEPARKRARQQCDQNGDHDLLPATSGRRGRVCLC